MIFGIGTDLIEVKRLEKSIEKFGDKFLNKLFSKEEIFFCNKYKNKIERFAGKFAAKEAFVKSYKTGFTKGFWFRDIEVLNKKSGEPYIKLSDKFSDIDFKIHVSVTHTENYANAVVILEK